MTSVKQIEANRQNALLSTGPRTTNGKGQVSGNAIRHGILAQMPVLPGERPEDWEEHRAGIFQSLAPAGAIEEAMAGRVALCLWRLSRLAAYETAVTAVGLEEVDQDIQEKAELKKVLKELAKKKEVAEIWSGTLSLLEKLPGLPDETPIDGDDVEGVFADFEAALPDYGREGSLYEKFLVRFGVPKDARENPFAWGGWTAGMVCRCLVGMANDFQQDPNEILSQALKERQELHQTHDLERKVKALRRRIRESEDRLHKRRMLPDADTLDRITRYEAHMNRQMLQALHELQRLRAMREGAPIAPPAALDVTLDADQQA